MFGLPQLFAALLGVDFFSIFRLIFDAILGLLGVAA